MSRASINLPLTTHPTKQAQSLEQNLVLLQSLRQSREKWISSAFPKFSSTARQSSKSSKNQNQIPNPPPHTIQARGKCDVAIGPHIFYDTIFYEVHYLQQSTPFYNSAYYSSILAPNLSPISMMITPEVVNQVNSAASTNPTLANLLQLAAAGKASQEQLKTLGLLVQSLATPSPVYQLPPTVSSAPQPPTLPMTFSVPTTSSQTPGASSSSSTPAAQVPTRHSFDLVIEFRENNTERWLLPRGTASVAVLPENPTAVTVTAVLPFSKSKVTSTTLSTEDTEDRLIELELTNTPATIYDSLRRWAGGDDKMQENRVILDNQKSLPRETYISYEVPEDPDLLAQLQLAIAPPNSLKSIKPSNSHYKRPSAPRKRAAKNKETSSRITIPPSVAAITPTPAPTSAASPAPPSLETAAVDSTVIDPALLLLESSATPTPPTTSAPFTTPTPMNVSPNPTSELNPTFYAPSPGNSKKPRQPRQPKQPKKQKMKSPPPVIRCLSCGQTDVPLLLGGRFCRPCVEGGRANAEIPQAPLMRSGSAHAQASYQSLKVSPFPSPGPQSTSNSSVVASGGSSSVQQPQSTQGMTVSAAAVPSPTNVDNVGAGTMTDVDMVGVPGKSS